MLKKARGLYTQAAEKNHSDAAVNLANMWHDGRGGPQSSAQTSLWLTKAAQEVNTRSSTRYENIIIIMVYVHGINRATFVLSVSYAVNKLMLIYLMKWCPC